MTLKWKIVKFDDGLESQVRAVPDKWIILKDDADTGKEVNDSRGCQCECYWPKVKYEFDLKKLVSKCRNHKSDWPKFNGIIWSSADTYQEAIEKEELAKDKSGSEIDIAYKDLVQMKEDKKTCKLRHKKIVSDNTEGNTSSSDSESEKEILKYPEAPNANAFLDGDGHTSTVQTNTKTPDSTPLPAKRLKLESLVSELNIFEESADATSAKFGEHSFSTAEHPINKDFEDATQNNKDYENLNNFESSELQAQNDSDKADDSIDEELVDECQKHDEEFVHGFAIIELEQIDTAILVPHKWQSLDFKYCFWPPEGTSNVIKDFVCKKVDPKINWRKLRVVKNHAYEEIYAEGLKVLQLLNKKAKQKYISQKPRITEQVIITNKENDNQKSTPISTPELDQLKDRDIMKVLFNQLENVETKQNKILVAVQNSCNVRNVQETIEDSKIEEVYRDIPCKTSAEVERVENKLEKDKVYKKVFKNLMKSLSSISGHSLMQKMISAIMVEKLQVEFSFCGRQGRKNKIAFNSLFLWPILRDAAVEKFAERYSATEAVESPKTWLKTAPRRIERLANKKKPRTLEDLRKSGEV